MACIHGVHKHAECTQLLADDMAALPRLTSPCPPPCGRFLNSQASGGSVKADLSPLNGTAIVAVRYAMGDGSCCASVYDDPLIGKTKPCAIEKCQVMD